MALRLANATRTAMANALNTTIGSGGKLAIYTGAQHATPGNEPAGTKLVEFTLDTNAFTSPAVNGVLTLDTSPALTVAAAATGTAGCFRVTTSGGTGVYDGTVGTSGADLNLNTVSLVSGVNVTITSGTFTQPAS